MGLLPFHATNNIAILKPFLTAIIETTIMNFIIITFSQYLIRSVKSSDKNS